jgi:hypothetical protein
MTIQLIRSGSFHCLALLCYEAASSWNWGGFEEKRLWFNLGTMLEFRGTEVNHKYLSQSSV